jgi:hypothetical protein
MWNWGSHTGETVIHGTVNCEAYKNTWRLKPDHNWHDPVLHVLIYYTTTRPQEHCAVNIRFIHNVLNYFEAVY